MKTCQQCGTSLGEPEHEYNFIKIMSGEAQEPEIDRRIDLCRDCLHEVYEAILCYISKSILERSS